MADSDGFVFDPPVCDEGCCTTLTESNELNSLRSGKRVPHPDTVYTDVTMKVRRQTGRFGRGTPMNSVEKVSSSSTGYDLKMLMLSQGVIDLPPRCFSLCINSDGVTQTVHLNDDTVLGKVCSWPKAASLYVTVDPSIELSYDERMSEVFAVVDQYNEQQKAKSRPDSDVAMGDDDVVTLDDADPPPPRHRDEGGLQGSVFRDLLPPSSSSPPSAATPATASAAATIC